MNKLNQNKTLYARHSGMMLAGIHFPIRHSSMGLACHAVALWRRRIIFPRRAYRRTPLPSHFLTFTHSHFFPSFRHASGRNPLLCPSFRHGVKPESRFMNPHRREHSHLHLHTFPRYLLAFTNLKRKSASILSKKFFSSSETFPRVFS